MKDVVRPPDVRRLGIALTLLILAGGCTKRERLNPLDPANSTTHGTIPGFVAIAANGLVELRWIRLSQPGVAEYALDRWRPGESPHPLPGAVFNSAFTGTVDTDVQNDSTYIYRLVARFAYGDSAVSPPDSATPGTRSISILSAELPGVVVLSPDARVVIASIPAENAFEDFDIDRTRSVVWLSDPVSGVVLRHTLNGGVAGIGLRVPGVTDVSVSNLRGVGWVASPELEAVQSYGPALDDPNPRLIIPGVGHARVVEAGSLDPTVWVGNDEGIVYRFNLSDGSPLEQWSVGAPIRAIALDQAARGAWVVTSRGSLNDLYYLTPGDTTVAAKRTALNNVADIEVETISGTAWVSERGAPRKGAGRISRIDATGATVAARIGLEPYGIGIEPGSDHVWVSDLASNRVLELDASAAIVRRTPPIGVPYGVIVHVP